LGNNRKGWHHGTAQWQHRHEHLHPQPFTGATFGPVNVDLTGLGQSIENQLLMPHIRQR
jgi:hypothetical protein